MKLIAAKQFTRSRRGSAMVMAIIISVIITGMVLTLAWAGGVQAQMTANFRQMDQAFYAAESGAQRVVWYCKHGKTGSTASPLTGTVGGYAYSAGWTTVSGNTIRVTSTSTLGSVSYTCNQTVAPPTTGAATLANSGNGNYSGNVTINGDVQTKGFINVNTTLKVNGNLTAGGAINGNPTVSGGTKTQNAKGVNPPDPISIYNTEKAAATRTINNPVSISVLDFTTASNGVILINGDAVMSSDVTVIGSGTVVVTGNWIQSGNFPITGTAQANIIVHGDLNISGGLKITGSVYGCSNWNQSGNFTITGVVLTKGDTSFSGSGTITLATPPTYDPRTGSSATSLTSFAGPLP